MRSIAPAVLLLVPLCLDGAELKPRTLQAFEAYVRQAEQKLDARPSFLWADQAPDRARRARSGEVVVEPVNARSDMALEGGGLVHDWIGTVFIPGATLEKALDLARDYSRHKVVYQPEVIDSKVLSRQGNDFHIYLRLLKKKVITVVLNTEHDVHYVPVDAKRWRSLSRTTKVAEVQNAGKPNERESPPGTGQGFLWRLDSYWRFEERDGGTWVECEAISLTRDVPTGLGWIIEPIIRNLPRDSLLHTLESTRTALSAH
jgi:hypothetical protein